VIRAEKGGYLISKVVLKNKKHINQVDLLELSVLETIF